MLKIGAIYKIIGEAGAGREWIGVLVKAIEVPKGYKTMMVSLEPRPDGLQYSPFTWPEKLLKLVPTRPSNRIKELKDA